MTDMQWWLYRDVPKTLALIVGMVLLVIATWPWALPVDQSIAYVVSSSVLVAIYVALRLPR